MYHYYMFNKPFGCVCARRDDRYPTVMDYFSELDNPDLSPVGRLDRATDCLLYTSPPVRMIPFGFIALIFSISVLLSLIHISGTALHVPTHSD